MFPAVTRGGGQCLAFPDVCKVPAPPAPPLPTPVPNMAPGAMAHPGTCTRKVKILNQPVLHIGSKIPMTSGDEAGVAGGVVSGGNMQEACFKVGLPNIKLEGNNAVVHLAATGHNGSNANAVGVHLAPSQTVVFF